MNYIRHLIADMDKSMVQNCLICGQSISDYRNAMWVTSDGPPKGFNAGEVFVHLGNPRVTVKEIQEYDNYINCNNTNE